MRISANEHPKGTIEISKIKKSPVGSVYTSSLRSADLRFFGGVMKQSRPPLGSLAGVFCLILVMPVLSGASLMPILDLTGGGSALVPLGDAVGGWQFQVAGPITLSALGLWDEGDAPVAISHGVGLWTLSGTLLATATVNNASIPVASASTAGQWLFTDIAPITLAAGDYVLGAVWGDPLIGADPFLVSTATPLTTDVTFEGGREATLLPSPSLVFPNMGPGGNGVFGPNAAFSVPEPSSALLLFSGIAFYLRLRGRRGHSS